MSESSQELRPAVLRHISRRELLCFLLFLALAWWSWPEDETPPPPARPVVLAHPSPASPEDDDDAPGAQEALAATSAAASAQARALAEQAASQPAFALPAAAKGAGLSLTESAKSICQRWPRGQEQPDEDTVAQDAQAAKTQFWADLLSRSDPLLQAIGMYGLNMVDALVALSASNADPRVAVVALNACLEENSERRWAHYRRFVQWPGDDASDEEWEAYFDAYQAAPQYQPLACLGITAQRWVTLEPDNGAAWLAYSSAVVDSVREDLNEQQELLIDDALNHVVAAPQYRGYANLVMAQVIQAIPADYSWWQRSELVGSVQRNEGALGAYVPLRFYCRSERLRDPLRRQICIRLTSVLMERANSVGSNYIGLILRQRLGLDRSDAQLDAFHQTTHLARRREYRLFDFEEQPRCVTVVRRQQAALRVYQDGGSLPLVYENAARERAYEEAQRRAHPEEDAPEELTPEP